MVQSIAKINLRRCGFTSFGCLQVIGQIAKQEDLEAATMDPVARICVVVALATFLSGTSFTAADIDFAEEEFDKVSGTLQTSVHLQLPHLHLP